MRFPSLLLAAALFTTTAGCGGESGRTEKPPRTTTVSEEQAIDIARQAVSERDGWSAGSVQFEAVAVGNGWQINAMRDGTARLIMLDPNGNVVNYQ